MKRRLLVAGAAGRLGALVVRELGGVGDIDVVGTLVRGSDAAAIFELSRPEILLDLSLAPATRELAPQAIERGVLPVIGTSGLGADDVSALREALVRAGLPGLLVPNFSLGAVLQMRLAEQVARHLPCVAIREAHHPGKRDSPSGTALATARRLAAAGAGEVPITAERRPDVVARQSVDFGGAGERLQLFHEVDDRRAYLPGILLALRGVSRLPPGLTIGLDALLQD